LELKLFSVNTIFQRNYA